MNKEFKFRKTSQNLMPVTKPAANREIMLVKAFVK
jgi:hypothetical protein